SSAFRRWRSTSEPMTRRRRWRSASSRSRRPSLPIYARWCHAYLCASELSSSCGFGRGPARLRWRVRSASAHARCAVMHGRPTVGCACGTEYRGRAMAESERPRTTSDNEAAELEVLALAEQFAAEQRAGRAPRLSAYLERYPQYAAQLTDFVAGLLADEP